jgi:diazepam-binding inhibitor (GABA receptor modulator, acyl-CoA-binding protein)
MSSEDFKAAAARASTKEFPEPSSNQKLQLYGLYKQATKGECKGNRPGVMDPVGRAKFDAWAACTVTLSLYQLKKKYLIVFD